MISKINDRVTITLPKTLLKRFKKVAKYSHMSLSKWIQKTLLAPLEEIETLIKWNAMTKSEQYQISKQMEEIIRIAKTPWLDKE